MEPGERVLVVLSGLHGLPDLLQLPGPEAVALAEEVEGFLGIIELEVDPAPYAAVFGLALFDAEVLDEVEGPGFSGLFQVEGEAAIGTLAEEIGHGAAGLAVEAVNDLLGREGAIEEVGPDGVEDLFFAEVLGADGGEDLAAPAVAGSFGGGGGVEIEEVFVDEGALLVGEVSAHFSASRLVLRGHRGRLNRRAALRRGRSRGCHNPPDVCPSRGGEGGVPAPKFPLIFRRGGGRDNIPPRRGHDGRGTLLPDPGRRSCPLRASRPRGGSHRRGAGGPFGRYRA